MSLISVGKSPKPVRYDPELLQVLAGKLQAQASFAVLGGVVAGVFTGCLFGYAATLIFRTEMSLVVPGLLVGGVLGFPIGRRKAQALGLQAQLAACQIQIEKNTRKTPRD
jgi:F0F1-type ATP synthase assembly protein I